MRAYVPDYEMQTPRTLAQVLETLARQPGVWKPFAGGTDLMVLLEAGKLSHKKYLNLWHLTELRGIEITDDHVTIGALATYTDIQMKPIMQKEFPMLCKAASETGGLAIQNRGTIAGNIVNASPAADSPPALLAYEADLQLISAAGSRWLPYKDFHTGYKQMNLRSEELLAQVRLPRNTVRLKHYYRKVGTRKAQAIAKVCFAATGQMEGGRIMKIRIGLGSVAPVPLRCVKTEATLNGRAVDEVSIEEGKSALSREIAPISDVRSTKDYRLRVSLNLLEHFLVSLQQESSQGL